LMHEFARDPKARVVGLKQTLRALQQDRVRVVYLANDVDEHIKRKIVNACAERGVELKAAGMGQRELGAFCGIEVGAAVLAVLRS